MKNTIKTTAIILVVLQLISIVSALTISDVTNSPSEVEPGKKISLEIEIENNLDDDVSDVEVALILTSSVIDPSLLNPVVSEEIPLSPEGSSVVYFEEIREGREKIAKFNLIADADAEVGIYKIPVALSYLVNGDTQKTSKQFTVSVKINAQPELILNLEDFFIKGRKNNVDIRITNVGLAKAKLLEVELQPSTMYDILSSKNVYIGDLESDDFDVANFDVYLKEYSNIPFVVKLKYRDASNKEIVESKNLNARIYSEKEAIALGLMKKNNTAIYIGAVVGLALVWVVWRKWKKWRKKKRAEAAGGGR